MKSIIARIDKRLQALAPAGKKKLSDRAASLRCGLSPDGIRTIRRQVASHRQQGFRTDTIEKLANGLETTSEWLLRGDGAEHGKNGYHLETAGSAGVHEGPSVPLIGWVRAGSEAIYIPLHDDELDRVGAPPGATDKTRALEIRGDSLGELFDRWIVYFDDEERAISPDLINRLCVVKLADGRVVVKKIRRAANGRYRLLSNTEAAIEDAEIVWAAKVIDMRPR